MADLSSLLARAKGALPSIQARRASRDRHVGVAASPIRRPVMDIGPALSAAALGALDEGSRRIRCGMRCVN